MYFRRLFILGLVLLCSACTSSAQGIRRASPDYVDMDACQFSLVDSIVNATIAQGDIPGAVVGVVRHGRLVFEKAYGYKAVFPAKDTMTLETMFDLASVSKCVGTTLAVMQLAESGKLRLMDPVNYYIPDFKPWKDPQTGDKVRINIMHLLTHSSGLEGFIKNVPAYLEKYGPGLDPLIGYLAVDGKRLFKPGTEKLYSCLNFFTLQYIVEQVSGERLCDYVQKHIFDELGLTHTTYFPAVNPAHPELAPLCAPTELLPDGTLLQAQVHDPTAREVCGGNAGNAGVFSNLEDLAIISAMLLNGGSWDGHRILSPLGVKRMFTIPEGNAPEVARALGWDTYALSPYTSGDVFSLDQLRGHTGYTGTSLLIDPATDTALIILTNRVHPKDEGSVTRMRSLIASVVAASIMR